MTCHPVAHTLGPRMSVTKCLWCGRAFTPRATGGKGQLFCRLAGRRALDATGRQWPVPSPQTRLGVFWRLALSRSPGDTANLGVFTTIRG